MASGGCYGATQPPQPPEYSTWLEAADPTPSAEAVSGVTDLMLQHTPDSSSWMGPSMFPQSKGVLCNDFLLTGEQVGVGAFGAIWKCERLDNRTVCACQSVLKTALLVTTPPHPPTGPLSLLCRLSVIPRLDFDAQPGLPVTTTFGTEIAILDLLTGYENIIQQLGVYEDVTHVHVVTEMCTGGSLASLLQETRMFKEKEAAWLFRCAHTLPPPHCLPAAVCPNALMRTRLVLFRKVVSAVNLCQTKIPGDPPPPSSTSPTFRDII